MSVQKQHQNKNDHEQAIFTLFERLAALLELSYEPQQLSKCITHIKVEDELDKLTAIGDQLRMRLSRVALTPKAAAEASAMTTPLVTPLSGGRGWIILCGFSGGRVQMLLAQGEAISEQSISPAKLEKLLQNNQFTINDWLLVQAKAPLANVVSPDHHHHFRPLHRLVELMRGDRADLMAVLGLILGAGLLALASPIAVQALVNSVAMAGMGQPLLVLSLVLFFFLAFAGAVHVLQSYLIEIVQRRIFVRLATDLAYRLPRIRREAFDHQRGEELVNRFFDILTVQKSGSSLLLDGLSTVVQTCIGLIFLAFYHPFLLAFDIVLLLAFSFILFVLGRGGVATAVEESLAKYALVAWLETIAGNWQSFKFSHGLDLAAKRTDTLALTYLNAKQRHYNILLKQIIGSVALYAIASTALLAIGGYLVIDGHLTLGQLVAAELIVSSALIALIKFGKHLEGYYDLMAGVDKIGHLLDVPLEREDGFTPYFSKPPTITVANLSYHFGAKRPVFSDFSFTVHAQEKIALLGHYGSGKTLLAELLCGMRQPQSGTIAINEQLLGTLRLETIRKQIMLLSRQELIEDSILENIRLGNPEISVGEVEHALQSVGLLATIASFAQGIDTTLSNSGSPLAASQIKLLLLARAIIGQPALLILDGILDGISERSLDVLAPTLFAADAPWTLVVLTSSSSIAARCERIVSLTGVAHHA